MSDWKLSPHSSKQSPSSRSSSSRTTLRSKKTTSSAPTSGALTTGMSSAEPLHREDVKAALLNKLYPRNCQTLNILGHEVKDLENYPGFLSLKAIYSMMVEKHVRQFSCDMIAKKLPDSIEKQRQFSRELTFYRYVDPELRHTIVQTMQSPVPRCYLARGESEKPLHRNPSLPKHKGPPEAGCDIDTSPPVLVLQDLSQEGMKKAYKQKEMDYPHCASALRALAQFHAVSAVVDRSDPKLKRGSYLTTAFPFLIPERGMFSDTEKLYDEGMRVIAVLGPHMDPQILLPGRNVTKVIFFLKRNLHTLLVDILKPHSTQLNTLCHSNCKDVSNFLFTQDQKHRPISCKLIGLSQVRYCRPAVDLSLVLYCAADRDVRKSKTHLLLEAYRAEFNKTLELSQKKHHTALPFSAGLLSVGQISEAIDATKLFGVVLRAFTVATQLPAMDSMSITDKALREFSRNEEYRARVTEAVSDLLATIEPYAGDCWLSSNHKACPHYSSSQNIVPKNPNEPKTSTKDKKW